MSARSRSQVAARRCAVDQALRYYDSSGNWWNYWRLVNSLQIQSTLLRPSANANRMQQVQQIALACARLACCHRKWSRPPETWCPTSVSSYRQWSDFISHVLHHYQSPTLFAKTWLDPIQTKWQRNLHLHLSEGLSVRKFHVPCFGRMTRQQALWFMQAPEDANIVQAIRWAVVRAAGAKQQLSRCIMQSIGLSTQDAWEATWQNVVDFLIRNQPISEEETHKILAFINTIRFRPACETVGPWMGNAPVVAHIDVRRWSLRRMRRWMTNWQEEFKRPLNFRSDPAPWEPSGDQQFEETSGSETWRIVELRTRGELRVEGGTLQHCVGGYYWNCKRGISSIWSLRRFGGSQMRREATIEIDPRSKRLIQAKSTGNRSPSSDAIRLIRQWTQREGIRWGKT